MREVTSQVQKEGANRRQVLHALGAGAIATTGVGTRSVGAAERGATEIGDWYDLDAIRQNLDGEYVLVSNLDADTTGYNEHVGNPDAGWNPIGEVAYDIEEESDVVGFSGTFDGNCREINDLVIDRPEENGVGLFAGIEDATVEAVSLTTVAVTGSHLVGGLAGWSYDGAAVMESSVSGDVTGEVETGGLVGRNDGELRESSADAVVNGTSEVGGLVGKTAGNICKSAATGTVTGESIVGGLVGRNFGGNIGATYAIVSVTGEEMLGGLIGVNEQGTVSESYAAVETN